MNKYHNRKVITSDGIEHDSRREANRWCELKLLERAGQIVELDRQVKFVLIPAQYEQSFEELVEGKKPKKPKLIERECAYIADFVYRDAKTGDLIVEDTKGYKDGGAYKIFVIKRKLMLHVHGLRVKEV